MAPTAASLLTALLLSAAAPPGGAPGGATDGAPGDAPGDATGEVAAVERLVVPEHVEPGRRSWFALPVVFWLPETRLGFGATGGFHFRLPNAPRPSSLFAVAVYTLNGQGSLDLAGDVSASSVAVFSWRARLVHFPDVFYGLGTESDQDDREEFTREYAELGFAAEVVVLPPKLRVGPRIDVRREDVFELEPGGELSSGAILGTGKFSAFGVGATASWDTRDRPLWPSRGSFAQATFLWYPDTATFESFSRTTVEGRIFRPVPWRGSVLGFAAVADAVRGDAPFTLLPKLGSTRWLRGYREGRFRDAAAWSAQSELRVPVTGRLWATAFAALGDVAPAFSAFRADTIKASAGVGARWRLTPEGANVRLDVAAAREGVEVYLLVLDAF